MTRGTSALTVDWRDRYLGGEEFGRGLCWRVLGTKSRLAGRVLGDDDFGRGSLDGSWKCDDEQKLRK